MSWVSDKAVIAAVLENLGYDEIAIDENTEDQPFAPHQNLTYKLKVTGAEGLGLTSNSAAYTNKVLLECYYINDDTDTRDANYDSFRSVFEGVIALAGFHGEINNDFEDIDELHCKGIIEFFYGLETC